MLKDAQKLAYDMALQGKNLFITGGAGVGKSYTIREIIKALQNKGRNIMVTAPTGIAALNIDGVTVHRAFKVPLRPLISKMKSIPGELKALEVLIMDEVSMCRIDLFDYVATIIIHLNIWRRSLGLPDVQVILIGDFFQLPPVIKDDDRKILEIKYGNNLKQGFAFQSNLWKQFNFVNIILTETVRQSDNTFIKALNMARVGDNRCLRYIEANASMTPIENAIILCSTNKEVKDRNTEELNKLKTREQIYEASITGEVNQSDKVVDDVIRLRIGARVMTAINDPEDAYRNGSLGTVTGLTDTAVEVRLDAGGTVTITRNTWDILGYSTEHKKDKKTGKDETTLTTNVIGTFSQIPLKLAYAVTIHKSQGQTYDAVNLNPYCWDYGQLYVALSRAKKVDTIHLITPLKWNYLKASPDVIRFYNSISK